MSWSLGQLEAIGGPPVVNTVPLNVMRFRFGQASHIHPSACQSAPSMTTSSSPVTFWNARYGRNCTLCMRMLRRLPQLRKQFCPNSTICCGNSTSTRLSQRLNAHPMTTDCSGIRMLRRAEYSKAPMPIVSIRSGNTTCSSRQLRKANGGSVSAPPSMLCFSSLYT